MGHTEILKEIISGSSVETRISPYFKRLFLYGIFFGFIPAMIIGIILYYHASRNISRNIRDTVSHSCREVQMRVEQNLRLQERQLLLFITGKEVTEFMNLFPPMYNHFQLFNRVMNSMNQMLIYDLGIESGVLVNFQHDWIISWNSLQPVSEMAEEPYLRNVLQNMTNAGWFANFGPKENLQARSLLNWLNPNTVKCIYPFPVNGPPIGFASVSIPCSWYAGVLASDDYAMDILLVDEQGRIITNKKNNYGGLLITDSPYGKDFTDLAGNGLPEEGFITGSRNKLMYSLIKSGYNNWTYVYIADMKNFMGELSFLMNITIGMGAAIMIGVIILAFFRARFFYRPVNRLYTRLVSEEDTEGLNRDIKTKDEFESIDSRIDAILRDKRNLEQRIMRESRLGKELFVHNLLNGEIPDDALISEKLELYHLPQCPSLCRIALIQFVPPEDSGYEQSDHDWLFIALSGIAGEIISEFLCFPIVVDGGSIAMILGAEMNKEKFREQLARRFERLLEEARRTINVDGEICISANMTSYTMISEYRAQTNEMFKYQFRYSQNSILFMEDMEESPVVYPQFPQQMEENILKAIRRGDNFETDAALEQFIRYTLENDNIRQWCNLTFSRLLVDIMRLCQEYKMEQQVSGLKGIEFEQLFTLKNWKHIHDWFKKKYTDPLLHLIHQSVVQKEAALIDTMKRIAETRYGEYLSVENIGEELSVSATFLRLMFKQGTGMAFNTYLTRCRIEAAKKMLRETDMLISEIAKKLTYQNAQNFIRTFRRETGITPGEYRRPKGN